MSNDGLKYAIVEYTTNKNFCNVYDALGIERLVWEVVAYDREQRVHLDRANFYLPVTRCKVLVHHVLHGTAFVAGWNMEVFGGTVFEDRIESRVFRLEYDPGANDRFARFPFRLLIASGPGKLNATNGIAPDGKPTTQLNMRFPGDDFLGMCLEIRDYLLVHQRQIEAYRQHQQQERYQERRTHKIDGQTAAA